MLSVLKTISILGTLLGLTILIVSLIERKKILKDLGAASDDELATKDDIKRIKKFFLLMSIGIFLSLSMGMLYLTFKLVLFVKK